MSDPDDDQRPGDDWLEQVALEPSVTIIRDGAVYRVTVEKIKNAE